MPTVRQARAGRDRRREEAAVNSSAGRVRSWWGWGWADEALPDAECAALGALLPSLPGTPLPVPRPVQLTVPKPTITAPGALAPLLSDDSEDRASHSLGKAYRDVVRALHGDLGRIPDLVARPRTDQDVTDLLDWAGDTATAVIPYGGGSSVVGGVEYRGDTHRAVVSLDLTGMDRVVEVDPVNRAARIQAGVLGPDLENQLRPHELTLRHFPQSFEFSTLGGWLATRAGGHYATLHTHIDDFTQSLRVVTPVGVNESWRLPGSGAGPSPDRLFLGSEGTLGVITEAWMRLQDRPVHKASAAVTFPTFASATAAARALAQSDLYPTNCRLLDQGEAALSGASPDGSPVLVLVLGFESAHFPVADRLDQALTLARDHGGTPLPRGASGGEDAVDSWRSAFLRMPYQRDALARMSAIVETFETACTWDRLPALYEEVRTGIGAVVKEVTGGEGIVNCRLTHVYPDGAAPYFTVIAAGRRGAEAAMWDEIKSASMEVLTRHRATITHHHAVGRDHRPAYDRQRPHPFALALRAAKTALDPHGVLNPGVLID
ncbi:FAD-binding oxidoreductase [Streptomyces sp. NPDC046805]|uniref:FAD-binding oxidoreductase n=1 Tax=Streptomyces sp. NPDC046805 TaxID=3155134 RepID=UPI0033DE22C2